MKREITKQAACLIDHISNNSPEEHVFGIGVNDRFFVGMGVTSQLVPDKGEGDAWRRIGEYLYQNQDHWVAGYIGYDILSKAAAFNHDAIPSIHLVSPDSVYEVSKENISPLLTGSLTPIAQSSLNSRHFRLKSLVSLVDFDTDLDGEYLTCIDKAYKWVGECKEQKRRMTVSRRIDFDVPFDLKQSVIPFSGEPESSVPCYWRSGHIEFGGVSPERTLYKEAGSNTYHCQKVSGTFVRDEDSDRDRALWQHFLTNKKNNDEHDISTADLINSAQMLGTISKRHKEILDMPNIRHFRTTFDLTPHENKKVVDVCRELYPRGVQPVEDGLKKIFQFESKSRGPYYGMFFVQTPSGTVIGVHIIRMLFRDVKLDRYYASCGSCITRNSDLMEEYEETRLKLSSIVARL